MRRLADSEHEVGLVVTQPARGSGRGRRVVRTPVGALAADLGFDYIEAENVNDPAIIERLDAVQADLGLVIAFGQKLRSDLLGTTPGGYINLHASLLPKYRGAAPINWAIINGEERTGCTVFRIVERMDAGPIFSSRWTSIKPQETAGELHDRLAAIGVDAVNAALACFAETPSPEATSQDDTLATKAPKLSKADGVIYFDRPATSVANHINGMTPWPGAKTRFQGADGRWENVALTRARRAEAPTAADIAPGTIDDACYVATGDGLLEILEIKPSSGRNMTWPEYVNGRHVAPGDAFVTPEG